jgi:recombination associated protein RdgC
VTEDFLSVVEAKRFLGREFLTWLLYRLEEEGGRLVVDGDVIELALGDRVVLQEAGDRSARLTLVDEGDMRPEMGAGLRRGKLMDRARISITRGERRFELSLDGGLLTYDSLRCPKLGPRDASLRDDPRAAFENDLFLRLADVEEAIGILDRLYATFCETRVSPRWESETLPTLRDWIAELG